MRTIGLFFKQGNKKSLVATFEGSSEYIITQMKTLSIDSEVIENFKNCILATPTNTQETIGGCYFILEGKEKIDSFIKDEEWIEKVKEGGKFYPKNGVHFAEMHRAHRKGDKQAFEKCLAKILKNYPNFKFEPFL